MPPLTDSKSEPEVISPRLPTPGAFGRRLEDVQLDARRRGVRHIEPGDVGPWAAEPPPHRPPVALRTRRAGRAPRRRARVARRTRTTATGDPDPAPSRRRFDSGAARRDGAR